MNSNLSDMQIKNTIYKKIITVVTVLIFIQINTLAQTDPDKNVFLDGDNYTIFHDPSFPSQISWTSLKSSFNIVGYYPIKNYWFVNPTDAHIVVNVSSGKNILFIELSGKKTSYSIKQYIYKDDSHNDFAMFMIDNSGKENELSFKEINVNVIRLVGYQLILNYEGIITGKNKLPIKVNGKVSLTSKTGYPEHLRDTYSGCDNTIYDKVSPVFNQYYTRSATSCESSYYEQVYKKLNTAFTDVYTNFKSKDFKIQVPPYVPITEIGIKNSQRPFLLSSVLLFKIEAFLNPSNSIYNTGLEKIMSLQQKAQGRLMKGDTTGTAEIKEFSENFSDQTQFFIEVYTNESIRSDYQLNFKNAKIEKISENETLIHDVGCKNGVKYDGGTYILLGSWNEPTFDGDRIKADPILDLSKKKLNIQSLYIRLACGNSKALQIIRSIDFKTLEKLLTINS